MWTDDPPAHEQEGAAMKRMMMMRLPRSRTVRVSSSAHHVTRPHAIILRLADVLGGR
jgi:hypothetical protein